MGKTIKLTLLIFTLFICSSPNVVKAEDYTQLDEYDFSDVEDILSDSLGDVEIDFYETVKKVISGESDSVFEELFVLIINKIFSQVSSQKNILGSIIMIAVMAAFFSNFTSVLKNNSISETGFFAVYMLLITLLIAGFKISSDIASSVISSVLEFMGALMPAYFLSVGVISGTTAVGFYEITLMLITTVDWIYLNFIIPFVNIYVLISLVNNVSQEDYFSKTAEIIKTIIDWTCKTVFATVLGINVIQSMILPSVDLVKNGSLKKIIGAIPGIGNSAESVTEILLSSGILIKNGIGVVAVIFIIILCAVPVIKLIIITVMYKASAALVQPVSDKRITNCVDCVATATSVLLKTVLNVVFLFIITIAIICVSTNII